MQLQQQQQPLQQMRLQQQPLPQMQLQQQPLQQMQLQQQPLPQMQLQPQQQPQQQQLPQWKTDSYSIPQKDQWSSTTYQSSRMDSYATPQQQEYKPYYEKKPEAIDFSEKPDEKVSNIEELVKRQMEEREKEMKLIPPPVPIEQQQPLPVVNENIQTEIVEDTEISDASFCLAILNKRITEVMDAIYELRIELNEVKHEFHKEKRVLEIKKEMYNIGGTIATAPIEEPLIDLSNIQYNESNESNESNEPNKN
jgi:hypothetical protein